MSRLGRLSFWNWAPGLLAAVDVVVLPGYLKVYNPRENIRKVKMYEGQNGTTSINVIYLFLLPQVED